MSKIAVPEPEWTDTWHPVSHARVGSLANNPTRVYIERLRVGLYEWIDELDQLLAKMK